MREGGFCASAPPIVTKIGKRFKMLKAKNERLILNRQRTIANFEKAIAAYKALDTHVIDQSGLGFIDESDKD
jgi:hypothetical protein